MGIRDAINKKPFVAFFIVLFAIAVAAGIHVFFAMGRKAQSSPPNPTTRTMMAKPGTSTTPETFPLTITTANKPLASIYLNAATGKCRSSSDSSSLTTRPKSGSPSR